MNALPWHPAVVHLPLALAMLMPLFAAGFAWALWSGRVRTSSWLVVLALQALLVGSGVAAMNTGEAEEDRVEAVLQRGVLHEHEELAEQFVWAAGATFVLAAGVLVVRRRATARALAAAAVAATLVVGVLGLRVGHAGGQLVYTHGAASAYTAEVRAAGAVAPNAEPQDDEGERHEERAR
jgi:uncharacterized membrane protein